MANSFFDLVKSSFFNPFTNGDIRANYDLLVLILELGLMIRLDIM